MKNHNLKFAVLSLFLLLIVITVSLTSCGGSSVNEIFVAKTDMPTLVYVEGQDLKLTGGKLTVVTDEGSNVIPLESSEISVSGYDSAKLGKQTVTITYKEKTTSIEVTVIPRLQAEGYENNYFVGDSFDKTKGKLKVARDNATTFTVNMSDNAVSVVSFDSSKAGATKVTLKYTGADGSVYQSDISVNVHSVGEVTLTKPYKNAYLSHDKELDLAGGYFTVKASDGSSFQKYVNLTQDMASGFDPSVVTIEDRDNPVSQTITFSYGGASYQFPITIGFSAISIIEERLEVLREIDWEAEKIDLTDEQKEAAYDAVVQYYTLSVSEREDISEEDTAAIARAAALTVNEMYFKSVESHKEAFIINVQGYFQLVGKSYEAIDTAITRLEDSSEEFCKLSALLRDMKEDFKDIVIKDNVKVSDFIVVNTAEDHEYVIEIFKYLLKTFNYLKDVPENWTNDTLEDYAQQISSVVTHITVGKFVGANYDQLYRIISSWRTKNDFFDIIYSYYYYVEEDGHNVIRDSLWEQVSLPNLLQDWYMVASGAIGNVNYMQAHYEDEAYLYDVSNFMYYYKQVILAMEKVKAEGNQLVLDLYEFFDCDAMFETYIEKAGAGYIFNMGEALGYDSIIELWDNYVKLIELYVAGDIDVDAHKEDFEKVFAATSDLTGAELHAFISSVNFLYDSAKGNALVFDFKDSARNIYIYLIANYYLVQTTEEAGKLFQDLIISMENFSLIGIKTTAKDDFFESMDRLIDAYGKLEGEDKDSFDDFLGDTYQKYLALYGALKDPTSIPAGDYQAKLDKLYQSILIFDELHKFVSDENNTTEQKNPVYPLLFAIIEYCEDLYAEIKADPNGALALSTKEYTIDDVSRTLDRFFFNARSIFTTILSTSTITSDEVAYMAWDIYDGCNVDKIFAKAAMLMYSAYKGTAYEGGDVAEIMEFFRNAAIEDVEVFGIMGANVYYYDALAKYLDSILTDANRESGITVKLLKAEVAYNAYAQDPTEERLTAFVDAMAEVKAIKDTITDTSNFDEVLGATYNYYTSKLPA